MATTKKTSKISAVTPAEKKTAKSAPLAVVQPDAVAEEDAGGQEPTVMLRKKEFIERIVAESGAKKGDVRLIAEAALKVLGDALSKGEQINLPPLGRAKIARAIDKNEGEVLVIKLRRSGPTEEGEKTSSDPLAEAGE